MEVPGSQHKKKKERVEIFEYLNQQRNCYTTLRASKLPARESKFPKLL